MIIRCISKTTNAIILIVGVIGIGATAIWMAAGVIIRIMVDR